MEVQCTLLHRFAILATWCDQPGSCFYNVYSGHKVYARLSAQANIRTCNVSTAQSWACQQLSVCCTLSALCSFCMIRFVLQCCQACNISLDPLSFWSDTSTIAGACSLYGICLAVATTAANTAPTISLITTAAAPATTTIKLGYTYTACPSGQQPYTGAECELGATAQDSQNGNLTTSVLVCAPAVCTGARCISSKTPILALHNAGLAGSADGTLKIEKWTIRAQ